MEETPIAAATATAAAAAASATIPTVAAADNKATIQQ